MIYFALIPPAVAFLLTFGVLPFFPHHVWWLGGWLAWGHQVYHSWYLVLPTMVVGTRHCHGTHARPICVWFFFFPGVLCIGLAERACVWNSKSAGAPRCLQTADTCLRVAGGELVWREKASWSCPEAHSTPLLLLRDTFPISVLRSGGHVCRCWVLKS